MQVPLLDLREQYAALKPAIQSAIEALCETQQFVLGPEVEALEQRIADYSQAEHGIGVSSGTDALLLALMALDVGPGDEIITSPFTFFATAGVIARLNARPVFCDIDPDTFNLSPEAVDAFIDAECTRDESGLIHRETGGRVKGMIPVHLYGQVAEMDALNATAREHGLAVIEDAAQAIGAELADGRRAGRLGDVACLSFFPTKNLGAFGDAGMVVTRDQALSHKLRVLRVHGGEPKYHHALVGGNFRLDALQAVVLREKLGLLDEWTARRRANARHYDGLFADAGLGERVETPKARPGRHVYNQYVIRCRDRDALRAYLAEQGIGTEIYYPISLHEQACFRGLGHEPSDFPESSRAAAENLALPIFPELKQAQREYVVDRIAAFYAEHRAG